jgi:hypothetical protein
MEVRPLAHLHGHVHEQRGVWRKAGPGGAFVGGVEYTCPLPMHAQPPPPLAYPPHLISNGSMKNNRTMDGPPARIVGAPRVIVAQRTAAGGWQFS